MKLALISPFKYLDESPKVSNYYMVLGHLLNNINYKNYYKNIKQKDSNAFVICDNSANEGYMLKGMELISLAADVNASELIAPDKYHDAETTYKETMAFLDDYYDEFIKTRYSVMAVPQGDTLADYYDCYAAFLDDDRINTIGIGYRNLVPAVMNVLNDVNEDMWVDFNLDKDDYKTLRNSLEDNCYNYTLSRIWFLKNLVKFKTVNTRIKKIHLLGLYNPIELKLLSKCLSKNEMKAIRSCDSAAPWQAAQVNIKFNESYGVVTKPKLFVDFEQELTPEQMETYKYNIGLMKSWINQ